ncbi:MAG: hypothetical protein ACJA0N_001345 [Pseudohongiellaceae bacterium]|jgi:hypothetical protein
MSITFTKNITLTLFLSIVLATSNSSSTSANPIAQSSSLYNTQHKAQQLNLHENKVWLSLLHFRTDPVSGTRSSEIDNLKFFLSSSGDLNPLKELHATLQYFFSPISTASTPHPQCLYPARFVWLDEHLSLSNFSDLPKPECPDLDAWLEQFHSQELVVVFPSAYLNSPSSMFGHSFLRFDAKDKDNHSPLLSKTVNFAADSTQISKTSNPLTYLYKGLFGGFKGLTVIEPFYKYNREYSDNENREIWEYKLNLSQHKIKFILLHLHEVKENAFNYYFLDENCSYRALSFINIAAESTDLLKGFENFATPIGTIRALIDNGLVNDYSYTPSANTLFYQSIKILSHKEKIITYDLISNKIDDLALKKITPKKQDIILNAATQYLAILIRQDSLNRDKSKKIRYQLIEAREKLDINTSAPPPSPPNTRPDQAHLNRRLSVSIGKESETSTQRISYRGAYHSLDDPLAGFEPGLEIEALGITLKNNNSETSLEELLLISITSLNPQDIFFKPSSWAINISRKKLPDKADLFLMNNINGSYGATYQWNNILGYAMGNLSLQSSSKLDKNYRAGVGGTLGLIYNTNNIRYELKTTYEDYLGRMSETLRTISSGLTAPITRNTAITASYLKQKSKTYDNERIELVFKYYF